MQTKQWTNQHIAWRLHLRFLLLYLKAVLPVGFLSFILMLAGLLLLMLAAGDTVAERLGELPFQTAGEVGARLLFCAAALACFFVSVVCVKADRRS